MEKSTNTPHYAIFICGATAAGLGIASQYPGNSMVVDRTGLAAREFIDAYNPGSGQWNAVSSLGKKLKEELVKRNILDEASRVHIPAAASVLFKIIQDTGIQVLLVTEVTEIKKTEQLYEITLYNNSGFQKVTADQVIDTTVLESTSKELKGSVASKSINAILHSKEETGFPFGHPDVVDSQPVCFVQGRFQKEVFLKYFLDVEDDWITARRKIHAYWQHRPSWLRGWQIASVASTFDIDLKEKRITESSDGIYYMPSCGYSNLLEAFEAGVGLGNKIKGGLVQC